MPPCVLERVVDAPRRRVFARGAEAPRAADGPFGLAPLERPAAGPDVSWMRRTAPRRELGGRPLGELSIVRGASRACSAEDCRAASGDNGTQFDFRGGGSGRPVVPMRSRELDRQRTRAGRPRSLRPAHTSRQRMPADHGRFSPRAAANAQSSTSP
jgi:hypothetical protein